jgi:hypothetical protein
MGIEDGKECIDGAFSLYSAGWRYGVMAQASRVRNQRKHDLLCISSAGFPNLVFRRTGFGWGMGWIRRSALVGRAIRHLSA